MKKRLLAILISFSVVTGSVSVPQGADAAAKVKLNKTKLNLTVGKKYKLKVKKFSGKVKWKTSNKKIVTVSKKGIVKARKKGKAKIWAILPGKKLKCTVTVKPAIKKPGEPGTKTSSDPVNNSDETQAPNTTENPGSANNPTLKPTKGPAGDATKDPSKDPGIDPTKDPSTDPTKAPGTDPTKKPGTDPTKAPGTDPTKKPSTDPTKKPGTDPTKAPGTDPTKKPSTDPTKKPGTDPTKKPGTDPTKKPSTDPTKAPGTDPTKKPGTDPTKKPSTDPTKKPGIDPTKTPGTDPTKKPGTDPTQNPATTTTTPPITPPTNVPTEEPVSTTRPVVIEPVNYSYASDYTIGYKWGEIVAYKGSSSSMSLEQAGVTVYDREGDRPFQAETEQAWDTKNLVLTQPVKYTTEDGVSHDIESMLTNFNFIADPTAIDNSDVDGKLYVYGTTEGFSYEDGKMIGNKYDNHSLTVLSTSDMVNWTDEGFMDNQNLTNEPSYSTNKVSGRYSSGKAWAPSGLKIDGDGDGVDEYYLFYTNGGTTGYVMADSPVGPWRDPLGTSLFDGNTPNCKDCGVCFDPAVLVDDKGDAYVYFGGLTTTSGRACKIKFEPGTGKVLRDGDPVKLPTYFMFEDNEINQFNGKYYYSYCSNFDGADKGQTLTKPASICAYVSSDPLNISFDPTTRAAGEEKTAFTDEKGVYRHFLGTILDNPSSIYGQTYNNHHHMQSFKNHMYMFYHSTVLNNTIHRASHSYRNIHVDEIEVDEDTDNISCTPTYEGAAQIEAFNPYVDFAGNVKEINATTTSYSAGVCSRRSDSRVEAGLSPMVLDEIDTGDWTKIQGVDFGTVGASTFMATVASETNNAAIEVYIDDPLKVDNKIASIMVNDTGSQDVFETISTTLKNPVTGVHDVYFVFRGTGYDVAAWKFESNSEYISPFDSITGITSGDNEIKDYEIKYENGVYNIYITGENAEPGQMFDVATVDGASSNITYCEFTDYSKSMGTIYVDMGNYEYTYHMYYWCSAKPKPSVTPTPTPTPKPTATPKPTPPPEMLDHYSAPYTLVFSEKTVARQGSSGYTLNDDGTVTIKVNGMYSGVAFVLPADVEENNFDTVTITYKDAKDVGDGFGCGLWRSGDDKTSEDTVSWGGLFKDNPSGVYTATIAGKENTNAWYVNKCLLFNNTSNDVLSAAPATVTITSVVFSHSKYVDPSETSKPVVTTEPEKTPEPVVTKAPVKTPKPSEDVIINPSDFGNSDYVTSDNGMSEGEVTIDSSENGYSTVTIPAMAGVIIKNPSENISKYKHVQITYQSDKDVDMYLFDNKFTDGIGKTASGQHEMDKLPASSVYNTVTYSADSAFSGGCISAVKLVDIDFGGNSRTLKIKSVKFLTELPEPSVADKATIVQNIPEDFKEMKEGVEYGEFRSISYYSDITNSERSANVVLPPGYDESKQYPVVYMLHGIGCAKEMFGTSVEGSSIAKIFGNLRAEGKCEDMIIVFPGVRVSDDPENNMHSPENYRHYDDFREDLINNLMPYMEEHFSVKTGRENTGICGWSMGGREALYIGLSKPEMFGYVAGYCPAFGLLPYTNSAVGQGEEGLLAVKGAEEDMITLPDEYKDNTFVMVCHGIWDSVVNSEPTRYHNALTTGGVPHIYKEYDAGHSDGVYDPGFYNFILNAFKLIKTEGGSETPYEVSISKDNAKNLNLVEDVVDSEDGVSFNAKSDWGGGGMMFWPAGKDKPFNLSDYGKMVVELTAEDASVPMLLEMQKNNSQGMNLSGEWFSTSATGGERTVIEYDLNKIEGLDREGDLYGVGLRIRGWGDVKNSYGITVHSIKFIPSDPVPELTSLKSVVQPVFEDIGTCINYSQLKQIRTVKYVQENYSSISLENEMKPDAILGDPISVSEAKKNTQDYVIPDSYVEETVPKLKFETLDDVLRIAKEKGLKLRAHTLVWHSQTPEFFFREGYNSKAAYVDENTMNARLEMYVRSVMHHVYTLDEGAYKDVVYTWDVANEYMHNDPQEGEPIGNWSAVYGSRSVLKNRPGYIKFAFETAYDCLKQYGLDGKVTLVYNDFNTYWDCRDNIIEMINYINEGKKICDGVGMQSHLGLTFPSVQGYLETVEKFIEAGFEVQITELDIGIPLDKPELTYETQAEYVRELTEGLIDIQNRTHGITGITWWGVCDAVSWRGGYSKDGNTHPLLFDENMYDPKPAYYSFINAFNKK